MTVEHSNRFPTRRTLMLGTATAAGFLGASRLGMPFISRGLASAPIKIGVSMYTGEGLSGAAAATMAAGVKFVQEGARLALAHNDGKAMGRAVEFVFSSEPDPAGAEANMKKLITEQKVVGMIGGTFAGPSFAMQKLAGEAKIPLIIHTAMAREITGKNCNAWTWRVPIPFDVQFRAISKYVIDYGKKWFLLAVNNMPGQEMLALARAAAKEAGATEVGTDAMTMGTEDYTATIAKIKAAKPDVIVGCLIAADIGNFLKAMHAAGMKGRIPYAQIGMADADVWGAGPDAASGIYTKTWHFADPNLSREDQAFVENFRKANNGAMPGTRSWQAYIAMRSLLASIDKAESVDPNKIRAEMAGFQRPSGRVTLAYRDFDHQMLHRVAILETKTQITDKYNWWDVEDYYPEKISDLSALYGTQAQNGCRIGQS